MQGYIITGNKNNGINESKLINKLLNKNYKNSVLCVNILQYIFVYVLLSPASLLHLRHAVITQCKNINLFCMIQLMLAIIVHRTE